MDTSKLKISRILGVHTSSDSDKTGDGALSREEILKVQSKLTREQQKRQRLKMKMDKERAMELAKDYRVIAAKKEAKEALNQYVQDWKKVSKNSFKDPQEKKLILERFRNQDIETIMDAGRSAETGAVAARTAAEQKSLEMENILKQVREQFTGNDSSNIINNEGNTEKTDTKASNQTKRQELEIISEKLPNLGELLVNHDANKSFFEKKLSMLLESKYIDDQKRNDIIKLVRSFRTVESHVGYGVKPEQEP